MPNCSEISKDFGYAEIKVDSKLKCLGLNNVVSAQINFSVVDVTPYLHMRHIFMMDWKLLLAKCNNFSELIMLGDSDR